MPLEKRREAFDSGAGGELALLHGELLKHLAAQHPERLRISRPAQFVEHGALRRGVAIGEERRHSRA